MQIPLSLFIAPALCALSPGTSGDVARFYLSEWFDE